MSAVSLRGVRGLSLVFLAAGALLVGACSKGPDGAGSEEDAGAVAEEDVGGEADSGECSSGEECDSGVCQGGVCQPGTCRDNVKNQGESDVDCGGDCPTCGVGGFCGADSDCQSGVCDDGRCARGTCDDGIANAGETDVDCGGPDCPTCGLGQACAAGSDCTSGACDAEQCVGATCMDGSANGAETDVDCGGPDCAACQPGKACQAAADCTTQLCEEGQCKASRCDDGIANGDESDVDCGGACDPCGAGKACTEGDDCESTVCDGGTCTICKEGQTRTDPMGCGFEGRGDLVQTCTDGGWVDTECQGGWYANCREIADERSSPQTGRYTIDPDGPNESDYAPREVQCEMTRDGGGWTLVAVISDDGQDNWTMANRTYWTSDETTFGSLSELDKDYKNKGIQQFPFRDVMFAHAPSGIWAAYDNVGNGRQSLGELIEVWSYPTCLKFLAGHSHKPTAGNLVRAGNLCETDLYFNLGDFDGKGEAYCKDLTTADNRATFGPAWNTGFDDGCSFDDPSKAGLGPASGQCQNCSTSAEQTETNALGFGGATGQNTGSAGQAENYMRVYIR